MAINAFPINTVPPAANLIAYTPFGIVTATDVQAAIQQLTGAIPSPGPGTDPLFLTQGLQVNAFDPAIDGNASDRYMVRFNTVTDIALTTPQFTNSETLEATMTSLHGQGIYNAYQQAKHTFVNLGMSANHHGSGQKNFTTEFMTSYGMSDTSCGQQFVIFAGGPIVGDEGQGFRLVSSLRQQTHINVLSISSVPAPSTINTTTTQIINASQSIQTVTVVSSAGAAIGHWVVVAQEAPTSGPEMEAVQLTAVGPGTISGIFRGSHPSGRTITPALRLILNDLSEVGQDRVLVNVSASSYSTGTIASISGGGFNGSGTAWANNIVGGYALNIGAVSLDSDNYTGGPFGFGPTPNVDLLRSWYQIQSIVSPTSLGIFTTSVAGDASYHGKGVGTTNTYIIRPCAKILRLVNSGPNLTGEVICETSTSIWVAGNTVEQVICPYPDVTGHSYDTLCFTNGGNYRAIQQFRNLGPRAFGAAIDINDLGGGFQALPAGDGRSFDTIISLAAKCNSGINMSSSACNTAAISLASASSGAGYTDLAGKILWNNTSLSITPNSPNHGMDIAGCGGGALSFVERALANNPFADQELMSWTGYMRFTHGGTVSRGSIVIDEDTTDLTNTNYTWGRLRWNAALDAFSIATEKNGTGTARDISIVTNGVEQLRAITGNTIKFSNPASFSANGGVATAITGVGPAGAATTVQKWLTIQDNTGATRYIPCF